MSVGKNIQHAAKKIERAVTGDAQEQDILDTLKREHREVEGLLDDMVESSGAAARKALLRQIKKALVPHVRAEEKVVYDAVIALRDKDAKIDGSEGYLEHGLADDMLKKLGKLENAASAEFTAAAKVLRELVKHHVEEEESNIWSDLEDNFSDEQRVEMNREFLAAKKKVRIPA